MPVLTKKRHTNSTVTEKQSFSGLPGKNIHIHLDIHSEEDQTGFAEITLIGPAGNRKQLQKLAAHLEYEDANETLDAQFIIDGLTQGKLLRAYRNHEELTQEQLANAVGISKTMVSDLESGKKPITDSMAETVAAVLNCNPMDFNLVQK